MFQAVRTLNRNEDITTLVLNSKGEKIIHNTEEELKDSTVYLKIF